MSELKELKSLLAQGKITRRDFLARLSALGITTALSPALLATPARAAKPRKGGRFRLGMAGGSTTDSLDPATVTDAMAYNINWQVRNCLVEVDYKGNLIPELAESWEATADATKWTFKLRRGVEFHNRKTLEMYVEMQRIVQDEGGVIIPVFANNIEVVNQRLRYENPAGNWELDGFRAAERWWFES